MDIGNISNIAGAYTNVYGSTASASRLESQMKSDYANAADDELMEACKQFEAYFLEQMFKSMMNTIPVNESMSGSSSTMLDYYKDQMVQELAKQSTDQNSLGLAQMLYEQMKRNYEL